MTGTPDALIERVLWHLSNQSQKLCWSGTYQDQVQASLTWWTVYYAGQGDPTPYETAYQHVCAAQDARHAELMTELESYEPPDPEEPARVGGRTALEWHRSVMAYLEWRLASVSRQFVPERLQPEACAIREAMWLLSQAHHSNQRCPHKEAFSDVRRAAQAQQYPPPAVDRELRTEREDAAASGGVVCRGPVRPCRDRRRVVCPGGRAARGHHREEAIVSEPTQPVNQAPTQASDYEVLIASGRPWLTLRDCFRSKLATLAIAECGNNLAAAVTLGVHETTVFMWKRLGRSDKVTALPQEVHAAMEHLVARLWAEEKNAQAIILNLREGLGQAALKRSADKQTAAMSLRINTLSLHRWVNRVVQSQTPRRSA